MSQKFYAADHHFYHDSILTSPTRSDFSSIMEMNKAIVWKHNERVSSDDTTYFLGDIIFCKKQYLEAFMQNTVGRMTGRKVLLIGNHDYRFLKNEVFRSYFEVVRENMVIQDDGVNVHLCHYPMYSWWNKNRGSIHFYGHTHKTLEGMPVGSYCVSLDEIGLAPMTRKEIIKNR